MNSTNIKNDTNITDVTSTYDECLSILEDKKKLNHVDLITKWDIFKNKYPILYNMLTINNDIDLNMLKYLCDTADKQNKLDENEKTNNEFEVGNNLAKKFLYNQFSEPSDRQKQIIKETLRKKLQDTDNKELDIREICDKININDSKLSSK